MLLTYPYEKKNIFYNALTWIRVKRNKLFLGTFKAIFTSVELFKHSDNYYEEKP